MTNRHNPTGKPLAAADWLEAHHRAKLPERKAFASRLASLSPTRVVDLGCATGLWLDLLNDVLPLECEFVGIDSDGESLTLAKERASEWDRPTEFLSIDLESEANSIPAADLTLAFNVFPYIDDLAEFLAVLDRRAPRGTLAVRQYDGASIRFGPMPTAARQSIEVSLRTAVETSQQFKHYDLDRVFASLAASRYELQTTEFELFARSSPFPEDFIDYYLGTLDWTIDLLSPNAAATLEAWRSDPAGLSRGSRYFFEVDLVAIVS